MSVTILVHGWTFRKTYKNYSNRNNSISTFPLKNRRKTCPIKDYIYIVSYSIDL